jgi:hypothetical protein
MAFRFEWDDVQFQKGVHAKYEGRMHEVMELIANEAGMATPVDTGALLGSLDYRVERRGFYVRGVVGYGAGAVEAPVNSSGIGYAYFVEKGTIYMPGRFMLTMAWDRNIHLLMEDLEM